MRVSEAKELFRSLTKKYFAEGATVVFANQSRKAKPNIPLVTIKPGNVKRPLAPNYTNVGGIAVGYYASKISFQVDLFTNGLPVIDDQTGKLLATENTAMDEMLSYADFLNSEFVLSWCHTNDVTILIDGDVLDLTGIVNDNNYEYRSRVSVMFYFTQEVIGSASVLSEKSIRYPVLKQDEITGDYVVVQDDKTGKPIYTTEEPLPAASVTGSFVDKATMQEKLSVVEPIINKTSGSGAKELADSETGYFDEVEIKEEIKDE